MSRHPWTGDRRFGSEDMVAAFQDAGYELGPGAAAKALPEPTSLAMLITGFVGIVSVLRTRRSRG